jgi:type II secretory ATPase GspE/PulE/Tfp pilus assembly ATPase PilB-like protein
LAVGEVAIQAALTGHLVFSTLHTNDAPSSITRLTDMGIKPFLVASSLQAVMAQRLVRVICPECKEADPAPDVRVLRMLGFNEEELKAGTIYRGRGCAACGGSGYRGRMGIFELMEVSRTLAEQAIRHAPLSEIRKEARAGGMRTLVEDGRRKILNGLTTPAELARIAQVEELILD